ncbi:homeobox protein cut-like 1 isoform X2 [Physella acuta]|uniref:homeobox protein cut-like 1 isoform X2 n=1 Tax=Physella acuta TaxID=109671 RepID=UPI0027DD0D00|nr:homeobox protein cut-like 1 isoform X2 [Physella acuta]
MAANMQSMCQYWKNFDLQELQRELDTTATELANRQDESEGSRKRLVEQSRDFKKNTPEDIRKVVAPLLKSFQVEIDSLSKRSKAAEAAFLSVYKKLIDLPDPVPVLEHAQNLQKKAHKVQDLEIENKQLRETLEEYNHEFAEVKNQEVTIKQLKEKLREHEERVEATAQTRAKEKERELQRTFAEKERQLQETQLSVAKKLGEAEQQITSLHSALETAQSELFEIKAKYDEATSAKSDEMEMVMADLDRANERAANAERQAERLKQQLAQIESYSQHAELVRSQHSSDPDQAMDSFKRSSQEVELAAKEKEIAQLVEDVQRLQASLNKLRESTSAQVARLEEELTTKNLAFRALEEKLRTQEDYEEVKRELRVLKSIEFANAYSSDGVPEESKSLEVLLLEKNKSLQTENTHLKVVNSGLTDNTTTLHLPTTTTSTTKKYERSSSMMSSSSSSQSSLLPTTTSAAASPPTNLTLAVSPTNLSRSSHIGPSDMTPGRSAMSGMSLHGSCTPPVVSAATIKQEAPSPASSTPRATPQHAASTPEAYASMSGADSVMNMYRMPSTPSSGRHSPTTNCKLSPDIPTPSQTPHTNSIPPQSPIALHSHIDPRHFAPPMSPFYGFPGSPFHPAFLPLNMVKSEVNTSSGGLDTGYVAKTVRELLSIHNIGQRLFAKHVLGLSQGTVSELLSKPKSWDKLTEKGRESYRKMHAWATDEANIMALKAISPKKGTQPLTPNNSYKEKEDSVTEERIANILNEAQVAMHMKKSLEQQQVANAVVSSIYHHELSKMGGAPPGLTMMSPTMPPSSLSNGPHYPREGSRKIRDHDSRHHSSSSSQDEAASAQEMVARIYRQELEKLKSAADAAGNIAASAMYAQELSRLNTPQNISSSSSRHHHCSPPTPPGRESPEPSPLALDCRSTRPNGLNLKTEPPDSTSEETASQVNNYGAIDLSKPSSQSGSTPGSSPSSETGRHAGSAFFLVRPRVNGHDSDSSPLTPTQQQQGSAGGPRYGSVPPAECLSPLQRMQNIANSLTSRPNAGMPNAKPLRAVLPPITQEEFDRYANMNTDELVKKVKETLSQYSISQRLFGESVLGLSQGSVSDLLARPKPWHMLTQKGREPFIRMQIFLEDADSIPKLVASQYRIPPDKLMRSSSRGSNEPAHRRRKSSMEDRNFDSPTQPKRPRVFFTEDQKDSLRSAYAQDPYPNQSTIESLAKNLNVGVKTVINWFHNHRMRAKQQHHPGSESNIKSEPDESSNQSDISSMSGEVSSALPGSQFFHGGVTPTDLNQWMFPQFEPMTLMNKVPLNDDGEDNKENHGGMEDDDDEMDEPDGLDTVPSNNNNNLKEKDGPDGENEGEEWRRERSVDAAKQPSSESTAVSSSTSASNGAASVNKRKRSNPQRVYEGAQLDRTFGASSSETIHEAAELSAHQDETGRKSGASLHSEMNGNGEQSVDHGPSSAGGGACSSSSKPVYRIEKIEKMENCIKSSVEHWDEEDGEPMSSIEKIQKHLDNNSADEDWEIL